MSQPESKTSSPPMEEFRKYLHQVQVLDTTSMVYKDECVYSFDTPESPQGLFVNLSLFHAIGYDSLEMDHKKTGQNIYLHQKWTKITKEETEDNAAPTTMSLGGEGGFKLDGQFHYEKEHAIVIFPSMQKIAYPNSDLPIKVQLTVDAILATDDAAKRATAQQQTEWKEEKPVSKYAENLIQIQPAFKISSNPNDWKCYESGMSENLWLNLSTGVIGSGRRNWDGSGGTGAALTHYTETGGKYPLAVKLGTITPNGADVYSYSPDEDCMVEDPKLAEHLSHWGINMIKMEKSDKTMEELEIAANLTFDLDAITEAGTAKVPLFGPGFVGLRNLGNSCYCNSVFQSLFATKEFQERYFDTSADILFSTRGSPAEDLTAQLAKLSVGLLSDRYATQESGAIAPRMVKTLLGRNHSEFSTNRQQDALEYYIHLLTRISREEKAKNQSNRDVSPNFHFELETRVQCDSSKQVRYVTHQENALSLSIPTSAATNQSEFAQYEQEIANGKTPSKPVRLTIPFESVLSQFASPEKIDQFYSSATGQKGSATKIVRFKSFPNYLMIHLRRYILGDNWTPKKLDAEILLPETLDLESLRSAGLQPNETLLPDEDDVMEDSEPVADENIVLQLSGMGFSVPACTRAALAVQNASLEIATNWLMEHMADADINDPIPSKNGNSSGVNEESLAMLLSMGIEMSHAEKGLKETGGDIERAVDWCFSHEPVSESSETKEEEFSLPTGPASYELTAIISHIGSNIGTGHYVCHIKKKGKWAIFNDRLVAESSNPPFSMGYLYLYSRSVSN